MASNSTVPADLNQSQAGPLTIAIIICTTTAAITVALRFYSRGILFHKVFLNDYCILVGMLGSIGLSVCMGIEIINGFGRHIATLTPQQLMVQAKAGVGGIFFFHFCHMTIKSSIILQYIRICIMRTEKWICYAGLFIVVSEGISWIVTLFLTCIPFEAMWIPHLAGARCINNTAGFYAASVTTISADIAILIFPMFLLRHSLLPWHQKLVLGVVLAFGGFACIASILRVRDIYASTNSTDSTWDKTPNSVLGMLEINLGIICSSVVTLKPLLSRCFPKKWLSWLESPHGARAGRLTITAGAGGDSVSGSDIKPVSYSESEGASSSTREVRKDSEMDVELGTYGKQAPAAENVGSHHADIGEWPPVHHA